MKDFNITYKGLKDAAVLLKQNHFKLSGKLESGDGSEPVYAKLIKAEYERYSSGWQNFLDRLKYDATQHGYNLEKVLTNFPKPILPEATVIVGTTENWASFDGTDEAINLSLAGEDSPVLN